MIGIRILIDADACPVKDEVYKVAFRRGVPVRVVSNSYLRVPAKGKRRRRAAMAKSQKKSSKEIRKPKAEKPKTNASHPSLKPGGIKGLENMKNK